MANHRWSASRFSCWSSCKTKYKLSYLDELIVQGRDSDLQQKGLSFHEVAEQMDGKKTIKQLIKLIEENAKEKGVDLEKYPLTKSIPRFHLWWHEYIEKWIAEGYQLYKENWEYGSLQKKALCGAIDLLLIKEDTKEAIIIDFKTGSKAAISGYENQLLLYVYMIANRLKIKKDFPSKIKTYLFFPLAGIKEEDPDDKEKVKKNMLKTFKQLVYKQEDVDEVIDNFKKIIDESETTNWDEFDMKTNANMSYACSWCAFLGHPEYCPASYENGFKFPRKAKIFTKQQLKEQEKATK